MVVIEVPVGKSIQLDESIEDYNYFNVNINKRNRRGDWELDWDNESRYYPKDVPLQMNPDGLEKYNIRGKYRFNMNDGEINVDGEINIDENSDTQSSPKPIIEKKEKEVYRYSGQISEEGSTSLISALRFPRNPLNAMLRF